MTQLPMLTSDATAPATRGRCHVHFGDWREQEPDWPRPFVYVSDVPYGISAVSNHDGAFKGRGILGDSDTTERDAMLAVEGWQAAAVFGPRDILRTPPWGTPLAVLIMDKGSHVGMGDLAFPWRPNYETIAIYGKGWKGKRTTSVIKANVVPSWSSGVSTAHNVNRYHPHEKPHNVLCELVAKAPPGLPIVDPFAGSGTTAVACALLGRECWTAEIDPQYFDVIRGRLAAVGVTL